MTRSFADGFNFVRFKWRAGLLGLRLARLKLQTQKDEGGKKSLTGALEKAWGLCSDPWVSSLLIASLVALLAQLGLQLSKDDIMLMLKTNPLPILFGITTVTLVFYGLQFAVQLILHSSINRIMRLASSSKASAAILAEYWELGSQNDDFLQSLFGCYEEQVAELNSLKENGARPLNFRLVREELNGQGTYTGAVMLECKTTLDKLLSPSPELRAQRDIDAEKRPPLNERRLARWTRQGFTEARTFFLKQWQRARRKTPPLDDLTAEELRIACSRQEKGPNYILEHLYNTEDGPRLVVKLAGYGQIMRSCDYLIEEAFIASGILHGNDRMSPLSLSRQAAMWVLPSRRKVFKQGARKTFVEPSDRAVGLGIAGVVTWHGDDRNDYFIFKKRSDNVGTYPHCLHCVPTGMFNGKFQRSDEYPNDLRYHAARVLMTEFFEELFSRTELDDFEEDRQWRQKLRACVEQYTNDPVAFAQLSRSWKKERQQATHQGQLPPELPAWNSVKGTSVGEGDIQLSVIGIPFDLLSLRPEIAVVIRLPSALHGQFRTELLNEEGSELSEVPGSDYKAYSNGPSHVHWVRSGQAAYLYGKEMIKSGQGQWTPLRQALGFEKSGTETV